MWGRLFPELKRFEAGDERRAAWQEAASAVTRGWGILYFLLALVTGFVVLVFLVEHLEFWPDASKSVVLFLAFIRGAGSMFLAMGVGIYLARRSILRSLRIRLNQLGRPTCLGCGYDLTGNESGVCPECGTDLADAKP